ncbi:hypothetical protein PENANT_c186G04308 [Penicillium antarcticum]|uniref:Reverse transcriptase domain-containing protein n=1 Tax=Penicillium antarcticum TaxID=416450 RepID=A0A1V6PB49_9EURO|nr:hypothetical protein PENANT_c186G04308 [Penicillium antarcticum]
MVGWVDDVCFMAKGDSERDITKKLRTACQNADQWPERMPLVFDPKQYAPHALREHLRDRPKIHAAISTGAYSISDKDSRTLPGNWLDSRLEFHHHREKAIAKANVSLQALQSLAGSTWGASTSAMRRIYQAVIIPQMHFGVSAWYQPMLVSKAKARRMSQPFVGIQKRAACLISEAFQTAAEALNIELHLPPIAIHMNWLVRETALRLRTGPVFAVPPLMLRRLPGYERDWAG